MTRDKAKTDTNRADEHKTHQHITHNESGQHKQIQTKLSDQSKVKQQNQNTVAYTKH